MISKQTQAIVISLDGVIYNIFSLLEETYSSVILNHQMNVEPLFFELFVDGGYQNQHRGFIHYHQYEAIKDEMNTEFKTSLQSLIDSKQILEYLNPLVLEMIETIEHKGYKLGIVSSLNKEISTQLIQLLPFSINIDALVCGNEVLEGKPEKDIYSKIAKKLDVDPHYVIAIESSLNGVLASYLADMKNIYVCFYKKPNERAKKYSNYQIKDLRNIESII